MKALDFLDTVRDWIYALAIAALLALCWWLDHDRANAYLEASTAQAALANHVATAASGAVTALSGKAAKEDDLNATNRNVTDELHQAVANPADRIAVLERRLREQAQPIARGGGECRTASAATAQGNDGAGGAGLPGMDGENYLFLDGQAQSEISQFTISAKDTGARLNACLTSLAKASEVTN